jgi:hypothetical protein
VPPCLHKLFLSLLLLLILMPLQEVPDQIAIGWFERRRRGGRLGMQMSRSYIHLNAQAPESLPKVLAVVPPPRAVVACSPEFPPPVVVVVPPRRVVA